jgi:hypothetical protein
VQLGLGMVLLADENPRAAKVSFANAKKLMCNGQKCLAAHMAFAQVRKSCHGLFCSLRSRVVIKTWCNKCVTT